jgi:transcription initiation factor IIE alpha subunit
MAIPIRNQILEIIKQKENFTDKELEKVLTKEGTVITEGEFNKVLLDLEIMGLISVSWVTKENRRIEAVTEKIEEDEYEEQIKKTQEKDYEASFPSS